MPDLSVAERLQPALLDRLTDNEPGKQLESRNQRIVSPEQLRKSVMRDLNWLLDTTHLASTEDLTDYPLVAQSVLNYGIPAFAGTLAGQRRLAVEKSVSQAILRFEPRLLASKLKVELIDNRKLEDQNTITLGIDGEIFAQPLPQVLYLKTELDLELGSARITELAEPLAPAKPRRR